MPNCGGPWRSRKRPTSSGPCRVGSRVASRKAAPTCRAASASGWRSHARWVGRPRFLFFDSFSALGLATDARLRAALRPRTARATVVIVSQRVSTVSDADQIVVLDDGVIVGLGRHDELLKTCPTYVEIVQSQLAAKPAA